MLEYSTIRSFYPNGPDHPTEQLNDAAKEGWRLVSTVTLNGYPGIMFIMEREKSD